MQKFIWGFFLALFVIDIIKVKVVKEQPIINPVETVEETTNLPVVDVPSKHEREYTGDKIIVEIGYWYLNFNVVRVHMERITKTQERNC